VALDEISICNMALTNIRVSRQLATGDGTIAGTADTSTYATILQLWYPKARDLLVSMYDWAFCRAYVALVEASDGTGKLWINEWDHSYTYPASCAKVRRFVDDLGEKNPMPWKFVVRNDGAVKVLLSDVDTASANVEYTLEQAATDVDLFPIGFDVCLSYLLAGFILPTLSKATGKEKHKLDLSDMANHWFGEAVRQDAAEEVARDDPDSDYQTDR